MAVCDRVRKSKRRIGGKRRGGASNTGARSSRRNLAMALGLVTAAKAWSVVATKRRAKAMRSDS